MSKFLNVIMSHRYSNDEFLVLSLVAATDRQKNHPAGGLAGQPRAETTKPWQQARTISLD